MALCKRITVFSLVLIACSSICAQDKVRGMIKSRSGATMTVQTADAPGGVVVLLTDNTKVGQNQGVFKARRKDMSMAALIPGLEVQAEGTYNGDHQLVADLVKFNGNDLERAQAIQAGLHETHAATERNREELEKQNAELKAQAERVAANQQNIEANKANIDANAARIAANKAMIHEAVARFGQLDDYYILDEVTILFANGKSVVDPKYQPRLMELAQKAKTIDAYMVQVVGYASSSGSATVNQKLSEDRAGEVTRIMTQDGHIPLTNMLAPGAMGESRQIGSGKGAEGEAQNRRVVVRILQNKGIAGLQAIQ